MFSPANANPAQAARLYRSAQPSTSEETLVETHLPLVKTTVDRMRVFLPAALDLDDLYSVGVTGLMTAARRYDPTQGESFPAFASVHIRGAVNDEIRRMDWMTRSLRDKAKKYRDTVGDLEQRLGRPAEEAEVREALQVNEGEYEALLEEIKPASFVPLDGAAFSEDSDDISLHEIIPDENQAAAAEAMDKRDLLQLVTDRLDELPDIQKKVLALYYFEELRLSEIASAFGLTEGRISQIHTQAVLGLRAFLQRKIAA